MDDIIQTNNQEFAIMQYCNSLIIKIAFDASPTLICQRAVGAITILSIRVVLPRMEHVFREIIEFDNFI